ARPGAPRRLPARTRRGPDLRGGRRARARHASGGGRGRARPHRRLRRGRGEAGRRDRGRAGQPDRDARGPAGRDRAGRAGRAGGGDHRAQARRADHRPVRRRDGLDPAREAGRHPMTTTHSVHRAVLAFGSNVGERLETLQAAMDALVDAPGVQPLSISPVYETKPFGGPAGSADAKDLSGQDDYLNAVAVIGTDLTPQQLLVRTQAIESALHRVRAERWAPRTIDVDIIVYDDLQLHDEEL